MRFSVTVQAELLSEAMRLTGVRRKREVIELALKELMRSRRVEELRRLAGSGLVDRRGLEATGSAGSGHGGGIHVLGG